MISSQALVNVAVSPAVRDVSTNRQRKSKGSMSLVSFGSLEIWGDLTYFISSAAGRVCDRKSEE